MIRIVTLAGALALFATTSASAQYAYLPPGYCGYDAYGGLIPCGYDYGSPFFFGGPFFGFPFFVNHRHFDRDDFHGDRDFHGHGFAGGFRGGGFNMMHTGGNF